MKFIHQFFASVLLALLMVMPIYAQQKSEIEREILVFFSDGISADAQGRATSLSSPLDSLLSRFKLDSRSITSAFPNFRKSDTLIVAEGRRAIKMPDMSHVFKVKAQSVQERDKLIDALKKLPNVLFAEPNGVCAPTAVPNDEFFSNQWALRNTGQFGGTSGADIRATEAWDIYTGNSNNIIGIVDFGVDATHPDLSNKVSGDGGYDSNHGSLVAGVASAKSNNGIGISGVDWNAQLHSQRVDNTDDAGTYQAVVDAVNYSPDVHIVNNSWRLNEPGRYSTTVHLAFIYAYKLNRVAVVAMGNSNGSQTQYPAGFGQGIIAVGATDRYDAHASFSNTGNHIDVSAPGDFIYSTSLNNGYEYTSGTSFAAPHVAGLASLLKGYNPSLANDDIENIIKLSADKVAAMGGQNFTNQFGTGRINARRALDYLRAPYQFYQLTATGGTDVGYTNAYIVPIYAIPGLATANYSVKRHEIQKTVSLPAMSTAQVWGRGAFTTGYANSPSFGMGFCEPVGMTPTTVTLRTYCYEIWTINGQYLGWYPCQPSQVQFAYTVWGVPGIPPPSVIVTGESNPPAYSFNSYTANITGGAAPFSYNWESNYGTGTWYSVSNTNPVNFGGGDPNNYWTLRVTVTDAQGRQAQDATNIYFTGSGGPYSARRDENDKPLPTAFSLDQNYPNPFNPTTTISYALPTDARVKLTVFDVLGREVETLVNETKSAGVYQAVFNSSRLSSGTYFYRLQAGEFVQTKKMILAK